MQRMLTYDLSLSISLLKIHFFCIPHPSWINIISCDVTKRSRELVPHVPEILLPCIKVLELHEQEISQDPIEQTVAGSLNTQLTEGW